MTALNYTVQVLWHYKPGVWFMHGVARTPSGAWARYAYVPLLPWPRKYRGASRTKGKTEAFMRADNPWQEPAL